MPSPAIDPKINNKPKKLAPNDVHYLALEGGGGKGFAYLGAIGVLEELKVMQQVEGFSGASAGAITALLLSIGYTKDKLEKYLSNTDFTKFYDSPEIRSRPEVGGCRLVTRVVEGKRVADDTDEEKKILELLDYSPEISSLGAVLVQAGIVGPIGQVLLTGGISFLLANYEKIAKDFDKNKDKPPFNLLLKHWKKYIAYMGRDMGFFAGCEARKEFDRVLSESMPNGGRRPFKDITFEQHYDKFGKKLLITGTNLSIGQTVLFSHEETPTFPVADAVRISMSLPFLFKPYVIENKKSDCPPSGIYVDGGLWNNLPFREFEGESSGKSFSAMISTMAGLPVKPKTLGLRLGLDPVEQINNFGDFLTRLGSFGLFGSGETQILSKYIEQMIISTLLNQHRPIMLKKPIDF